LRQTEGKAVRADFRCGNSRLFHGGKMTACGVALPQFFQRKDTLPPHPSRSIADADQDKLTERNGCRGKPR
jgi:hypothetical protein